MCLTSNIYAQDDNSKSEYRYWSFIAGMNHGFGSSVDDNNSILMHTDKGDMYRKGAGGGYVPGYQVGFLYHYDFKNNKTGIVAGLEYTSYGFKNKYETLENNLYTMKETYRATAVCVPILLKFGTGDIYRDMKYFTIGVKAYYNIGVSKGETCDWDEGGSFGEKLEGDALSNISLAGVLGFNIKMFSFNINYQFKGFINDGAKATVDGVEMKPYSHLGGGHLFFCTSLNVPMTRWLSVNNWQAEKMRRKLHK